MLGTVNKLQCSRQNVNLFRRLVSNQHGTPTLVRRFSGGEGKLSLLFFFLCGKKKSAGSRMNAVMGVRFAGAAVLRGER